MRRRRQSGSGETTEQTLARLQASTPPPPSNEARDSRPTPSGPSGAMFPTVRLQEGYEITEVEAFFATIETATADEIRDKQFSTVRLRTGYDMDAVDHALDGWQKRAGPTTTAPKIPQSTRAPWWAWLIGALVVAAIIWMGIRSGWNIDS